MKKEFYLDIPFGASAEITGNQLKIVCDNDMYSTNYSLLTFEDANGYGWLKFSKNGIVSIGRIK